MSWLSQRWSSRALIGSVLLWTAWLSACGGGQQPPHGGAPDTTGPKISGVAWVSSDNAGNAQIRVEASDETGIAALCAKTTSTRPSSSDSCFVSGGGGSVLTVNVSGAAANSNVYVWGKDLVGNITNSVQAVAMPAANGVLPCSSAGLAAANSSGYTTVVCMGVANMGVSAASGEIVIGLESAAPISVSNFLAYVNAGFYPNTVFHRVLSSFMVQAGGSTFTQPSTYSQKTTGLLSAVALERTSSTGLSNTQYTVALARTSAPDSATSQFFINVVDNSHTLDASGTTDPGNGYAVFGKVISGTSTVDAIKAVPVGSNGSGETSQPTGTPPTILWAYRIK